MINLFKIILLVFGIAVLLNPIQGQQIDFTNLCLLVETGTQIAASSSCSANYYACTSNGPVLRQCLNGYVFDKNQQACVPRSQAPCANPCYTAQVLPSWVAASGTCTGYYYCNATGGYRGDCPSGELFDESKQQCLYSSESCNKDNLQETNIDLCAYIPNGIYFGDAGQCANWNICNNGILKSGSCATNYMYNVQKSKCDFTTNTICSQVTYDAMLTNTKSNAVCSSKGAIKVGSQCNNYYVCDGQMYQLENCPVNLFFDTVSQTCVNRMNARNDCNRCIGVSSGFVNAYSTTGCTLYYYCQNGEIKSKGTCTSGDFDEIAGACVTGSKLTYACCNPTTNQSVNSPAGNSN